MLQIKLRSLILDIVHMLDVVKKLAAAGVSSCGDWLWQKQLRFYLVNKVFCLIFTVDGTSWQVFLTVFADIFVTIDTDLLNNGCVS